MPVRVNAHHCQLPATPCLRMMSVTRFGVSALNVVATIDKPASHHGTERPDAKNSVVFFDARLPKKRDGKKQMHRLTTTIIQSRVLRTMGTSSITVDMPLSGW